MRKPRHSRVLIALALSLGAHGLILLKPVHRPQLPAPQNSEAALIRLELSYEGQPPTKIEPAEGTRIPEPQAASGKTLIIESAGAPINREDIYAVEDGLIEETYDEETSIRSVKQIDEAQLTRKILSSAYLSEEPTGNPIFPASQSQDKEPKISEFHFPERENMYVLLEKPLPELPFDYIPGYVNFSYDSGFRGEMQRFWDVITPEFSFWLGDSTEVQCKVVLIIAGCSWD